MALLLDADAALLCSLRAYLTAGLTSLVPATNIRSAYTNAQLVQAISTGTFNPLVVVLLGAEKPAKLPSGGSSGKVAYPAIAAGQTTVTTLYPQAVIDRSVQVTVAAGGEQGKSLRGQVKNAILGIFGSALSLALPDDDSLLVMTPTPAFTPTTATTYGLSAQLSFVSGKPDDRLDERQLYRHDLLYTAQYAVYTALVDPVITGVSVATVIPTYPTT